MWHLWLVLVSCCCFSGAIGAAVSVVEGESVTIDCGFQTTVNGGNLLWQVTSNGSEIPLGFIVPGDHFCGIDTIECIVHTNGSITLFNVALSDGEKYYRCLRGDREGYHYFSDVNFTVVSKESLGHPVIQPLTGPNANVYMIEERSVIHSYEEPTCEDKEDGALMVTCFPPSGVIVDKVYDQVHCICTDSDGNSNSLNISVNRTKGDAAIDEVNGSMPKSYKLGGEGVIYSYEQPTCEDDEDGALITSCYPPPGLVVDKVYDHVDCNCTDSDGNFNSLNISVKSHTELKENSVAASIIRSVTILILILVIIGLFLGFVWPNYQRYKIENANAGNFDVSFFGSLGKGITGGSNHSLTECDEEGQQLNSNTEDVSQRPNEKEAECRDKSDKIATLNEENQNKDKEIADLRQKLTEKETECTDKSKEIDKLKMDQQKMRYFYELFELMQRLTERETECTDKSKEIDQLQMEQKKDVMERQTIMEQTEFEAVWNMIPVMLQQQLRKHLLSQDKKEKKKAGGEDKDDAKPKEVTAIDQAKACEDDVIS